MNILVDENCLWLAREPVRSSLKSEDHQVRAVGEPGCPSLGASDQEVCRWLQEYNYAILTHDFDDFYHFEENIVVLGLIARGVFTHRADIIIRCIANCMATSGNPIPVGLYILNQYNW